MNYSKRLGALILDTMKDHRLSLRRAAALCDVSFGYFTRITKGDVKASVEIIDKIANGLHVPYSLMFQAAGEFYGEGSSNVSRALLRVEIESRRLKMCIPFADFKKAYINYKFIGVPGLDAVGGNIQGCVRDFLSRHGNNFLAFSVEEINDKPAPLREVLFLSAVHGLLNTIELDEIFFILDLIPSRFFNADHTPHFAKTLKKYLNVLSGAIDRSSVVAIIDYSQDPEAAEEERLDEMRFMEHFPDAFGLELQEYEQRKSYEEHLINQTPPDDTSDDELPSHEAYVDVEEEQGALEQRRGGFSFNVSYGQSVAKVAFEVPIESSIEFVAEIMKIYERLQKRAKGGA